MLYHQKRHDSLYRQLPTLIPSHKSYVSIQCKLVLNKKRTYFGVEPQTWVDTKVWFYMPTLKVFHILGHQDALTARTIKAQRLGQSGMYGYFNIYIFLFKRKLLFSLITNHLKLTTFFFKRLFFCSIGLCSINRDTVKHMIA